MHSDPRNRQPRTQNRSTPTLRKSISPRPPQAARPKSTIFGPDCFDQFNPAARSTSSLINNPATSSPGTPAGSSGPGFGRPSPYSQDGKIIDFHGKEIDPSDRLPETSWAPEPEPKGPIKEKAPRDRVGLTGARGRSPRESFGGSGGSRFNGPGSSAGASPMNLASASSTPRDSPTTTVAKSSGGMIRARLKKPRPQSMAMTTPLSSQGASQPFRDIPNPVSHSSGGYGSTSPPMYASDALVRNHASFDASNSAPCNGSPTNFGGSAGYSGSPAGLAGYTGGGGIGGPPPIPAKVPLNEGSYGHGYGGPGDGQGDMSALSQELRSIDIGSGRGRVAGRRMLGFR